MCSAGTEGTVYGMDQPPIVPSGEGSLPLGGHDIDLPPAPAAKPRRRWLAGGLVALLALGGTAAAAISLLSGDATPIEMAVPADADLALVVSLDPPAGQKMNLLQLIGRFPSLAERGDLLSEARDRLNESLAEFDLSIGDLTWVGSEVAFIGQIDGTKPPEDPDFGRFALVLATRDETAASDTLQKARESGDQGGWSARDHEGVEVWIGPDGAYAVDQGFAIVASNQAAVASVLDVLAERAPALGSSEAYEAVEAQLPDQRLGMAFVNIASLFEDIQEQLVAVAGPSPQLQDVEAIRGVGMSVSAEPDGFAFDTVVTYDPAKISDEGREQLETRQDANLLLDSIPQDASVVVGQKGYTRGLEQALERLRADTPELALLDGYGVTGPGGLLEALSGDVAFEVGPGAPVGISLLLATDEESAAQAALDRLVERVDRGAGVHLILREVGGVAVTVIEVRGPFQVAYAVTGGKVILSSSLERLQQLLGVTPGSGSIVDDPDYQQATERVPTEDSVFFIDIRAIVEAVRGFIPDAERAGFDEQVRLYVDPIEAVVGGAESDGLSQHTRLFVVIPNKE